MTAALRAWRLRNIARALRDTGMDPEEIEAGLQAVRDDHAHAMVEMQRLRMEELDLTGQKARIVGRIIDLIDPDAAPTAERSTP